MAQDLVIGYVPNSDSYVVVLVGGAEVASTATSTVPTSASDSAVASSEIVLRGDGLGVARFGDRAQQVIDRLSLIFGPPNVDGAWLDSGHDGDQPPPCDYVSFHEVSFGDLMVVFTADRDGSEEFRWYGYSAFDAEMSGDRTVFPADLRTEKGLGLFDQMTDAMGVYDDLWIDYELGSWGVPNRSPLRRHAYRWFVTSLDP